VAKPPRAAPGLAARGGTAVAPRHNGAPCPTGRPAPVRACLCPKPPCRRCPEHRAAIPIHWTEPGEVIYPELLSDAEPHPRPDKFTPTPVVKASTTTISRAIERRHPLKCNTPSSSAGPPLLSQTRALPQATLGRPPPCCCCQAPYRHPPPSKLRSHWSLPLRHLLRQAARLAPPFSPSQRTPPPTTAVAPSLLLRLRHSGEGPSAECF
jgi:hypothetical protein